MIVKHNPQKDRFFSLLLNVRFVIKGRTSLQNDAQPHLNKKKAKCLLNNVTIVLSC
jgi:hypothetical protein